MTRTAKVLRYVAFTLMALFGLSGGIFVAGEAFFDPGGWRAVAMTAAWALPLIALSVVALRRPAAAGRVFVGATGVVVLFTLADSTFGISPRNTWGPVAAVVVFAIGVALAFLGLHRAELAGLLMVVVGLAQLAATVIDRGSEPGAMFGGSSGVAVLPILLVGLLFLLAGVLGSESLRSVPADAGRGQSTPVTHASWRSRRDKMQCWWVSR